MSRCIFVLSPAEQYVKLTQSKESLDPATINVVFDQLPPLEPSQLLGSWKGGFFDTGHKVGELLNEIKWIGKDFFSIENVDPVIVQKDGQRDSWGKWGRATVREVKSRGQVSATMIYDERAVFDYFRYVNDNMVAGIMEGKELGKELGKGLGEDGLFYFYLVR